MLFKRVHLFGSPELKKSQDMMGVKQTWLVKAKHFNIILKFSLPNYLRALVLLWIIFIKVHVQTN